MDRVEGLGRQRVSLFLQYIAYHDDLFTKSRLHLGFLCQTTKVRHHLIQLVSVPAPRVNQSIILRNFQLITNL